MGRSERSIGPPGRARPRRHSPLAGVAGGRVGERKRLGCRARAPRMAKEADGGDNGGGSRRTVGRTAGPALAGGFELGCGGRPVSRENACACHGVGVGCQKSPVGAVWEGVGHGDGGRQEHEAGVGVMGQVAKR